MRHVSFAIASICMMLVVPQAAKAQLSYTIFPDGQSLSGTIEITSIPTNTNGSLPASDIQYWSVTVDGKQFTSQDPDASATINVNGAISVNSDGIYAKNPVYSPAINELTLTSTPADSTTDSIDWTTTPTNWSFSATLGSTTAWSLGTYGSGATLTIATAAVAVPEPSTLVGAGLVVVCGIAYGLARKRRAQRKPRNEP